MASREQLKEFFKNESKPSEVEFEELIDSLKHVDDEDTGNGLEFAEISEARQGVDLTKMMSPFLTKEAIVDNVRLAKLALLLADVNALINPIALNVGIHTGDTENPHGVTKSQVGLSNVPNTVSSSTNYNNSNSLATSKAVYDVAQEVVRIDSLLLSGTFTLDFSTPASPTISAVVNSGSLKNTVSGWVVSVLTYDLHSIGFTHSFGNKNYQIIINNKSAFEQDMLISFFERNHNNNDSEFVVDYRNLDNERYLPENLSGTQTFEFIMLKK